MQCHGNDLQLGNKPSQANKYADSLWIPDLDLRFRDRAVLKRGKLCDKHMYAAHELLRQQLPRLQGFLRAS